MSMSFIAPRQRGQDSTSTANTRWSSHAQGCRFECFVLPGGSSAGLELGRLALEQLQLRRFGRLGHPARHNFAARGGVGREHASGVLDATDVRLDACPGADRRVAKDGITHERQWTG
jgi:hypothetical protein